MVFFVYNRIDTQQKDKLGNVLQVLSTSLHEAFHSVSQLSGTSEISSNPLDLDRKETGLFRRFKLNASNSNQSDVRILGNIKENFAPPKDVSDLASGKALCEFREHIHNRVTWQDSGSSRHQWKSLFTKSLIT